MMRPTGRISYQGKRVLVTGGMGFIGSNLSIALVEEGAQVTVVDSQVPGCGANPANLAPVRGRLQISTADIRDAREMRRLIPEQEIIFNLAGEISHLNSIRDPQRDLAINCGAQLQFLDLCRTLNPSAAIVYASSRQVYGRPQYLPVDEQHPVHPVDFNGVHKFATEQYHFLLRRQFQVPTICLRLGNTYGPRQAIHQDCRGFIDTFLRTALLGKPIVVFGDGTQVRDMLYVGDAVEAFLRAGLAGGRAEPVYNVGSWEPVALWEIAQMLARLAGGPQPTLAPFPSDRLAIDIGDFHTDARKIHNDLGWFPRIGLAEGLKTTLQFFQGQEAKILDASRVILS